MNPNIASLIRHILTSAGGFLVAKGHASADEISQIAGAIVSLIGIGWAIKKNAAGEKKAE